MEVIDNPVNGNGKSSVKADVNNDEVLNKAIKNKIPLLFLQKLSTDLPERLQVYYKYYNKRRSNVIQLITATAHLLERNEIEYTFFKTIRPFPDAPTDIDVLFKSKQDLQKSYRILSLTGQKFIAKDSFTYTLFSKKHRLNIDLYLHPTVADLIYLNKDLLMSHVAEVELDGSMIRTLSPEAEIIALTSHSLYKENIYTLNDHYTFLTLLKEADLQRILELADKAHSMKALKISAILSHLINEQADKRSTCLKDLIALFKKNRSSLIKLKTRQFDLPYKYNPYDLVKCFVNKIRKDNLSLSTTPLLFKRGLTKRFLTLLAARVTA